MECGAIIFKTSTRCRSCVAKNREKETIRMPRIELKNKIRNQSFLSIGKEFGVTDNAVRKWCDYYKLPRKKTEIDSYSDEEWDKI